MTSEQEKALIEAAWQVLWKLDRNEATGPARITRQDATVKMLQAAFDEVQTDTSANFLAVERAK